MDMIKARNLSSHTYNPETADAIAKKILNRLYPAFDQMHAVFARLADEA
ncbi:hypothetical protein GMSM_46260 [Geomonas sp. Red276]